VVFSWAVTAVEVVGTPPARPAAPAQASLRGACQSPISAPRASFGAGSGEELTRLC
jgi:hypothetical protein